MNWQIFLTISVLSTAASTLVQRVLLRKKRTDPIALSIVFQLLGGVFVGTYALLKGFQIPHILPVLPNFFLMPILYGSANIFLFYALKYIEASEYTILYATRMLWTIFAAIVFLQESFSMQQVLGTFLILSSVVLVSWKSAKFEFNKGTIFALLGAGAFGLGLANDSFIVRNVDVPSYMSIAFILPALVTWAIFPKSTKKMRALLEKENLPMTCIVSAMAGISAVTYFTAYQIGRNAAQIAALNQTATILTVILGIVLLKERSSMLKKLLAAIISAVGVILIS